MRRRLALYARARARYSLPAIGKVLASGSVHSQFALAGANYAKFMRAGDTGRSCPRLSVFGGHLGGPRSGTGSRSLLMAPWTANVRNYFSRSCAQPACRLTILFREHCLCPSRASERASARTRLPNDFVDPRLIVTPRLSSFRAQWSAGWSRSERGSIVKKCIFYSDIRCSLQNYSTIKSKTNLQHE